MDRRAYKLFVEITSADGFGGNFLNKLKRALGSIVLQDEICPVKVFLVDC